MSPENKEQVEFTLNENVRAVIDTLRRIGLAWIADEIGDAVLEDWVFVQEAKTNLEFPDWGRNRAIAKTRELGQEAVASLVLRNYFVDLCGVWNEAQNQLREAIGDKRIHVQIMLPGGVQSEVLFEPAYEKVATELRRILGELLPVPEEAESL